MCFWWKCRELVGGKLNFGEIFISTIIKKIQILYFTKFTQILLPRNGGRGGGAMKKTENFKNIANILSPYSVKLTATNSPSPSCLSCKPTKFL